MAEAQVTCAETASDTVGPYPNHTAFYRQGIREGRPGLPLQLVLTVYPGWYQGRATHIHLKVIVGGVTVKTTQLAFPEAISQLVYANVSPYSTHGQNSLTNASDNVFSDGTSTQMVTLTGDTTNGYGRPRRIRPGRREFRRADRVECIHRRGARAVLDQRRRLLGRRNERHCHAGALTAPVGDKFAVLEQTARRAQPYARGMRRRNFLHTVLAGSGLAGAQMFAARAESASADAAPRTAVAGTTSIGAAAQAGRARGPIIDVHMHAYPADAALPDSLVNPATGKPTPPRTGEAHLQACLAEMKRLNIVKGVVSGGDGDRIAAAVHWHDAAPDRFIAAAGIRGSEEIPLPEVGVLRKAFQDGRLRVLGEVTAQYAGLSLSDSKYDPYLALAEEFDVPVAVHMGMGPPGISFDPCCRGFRASLGNPAVLEEALNKHPKLRLNVMHGGWPYLQETLALLFIYPQVYVDLGAIDWALPRAEFHHYLGALMRAGFGKRLLFGSDQMYWPEAIGMAVDAVEAAPFLTAADKRDIFYGNAARFLRLESGAERKSAWSRGVSHPAADADRPPHS